MKSIGKLFIWRLSSMNKISRSSKVFNSTNYTSALEKNLGILSEPLKFNSKVPQEPVPNNLTDSAQPERIKVDKKTIELLERLSLVNLDDREAINTLEDAIVFAGHVLSIDTENVEPLYTVLEDRCNYSSSSFKPFKDMPPKQSIINKIFEICSHQSFFKPTYSKCGSHVLRYNCGPMGSLLQENVKNEWTHAMLSNRDIDMFLKLSEISKQSGNNSKEIVECLVFLKEVGRSQLPCGVANIINYNFSDESDTKTSFVENNNVGECRNHVNAGNMLVNNFVNTEVQLLAQEAQKTQKQKVKTTSKTIKIKKIKGTFADNIKNMEPSEGNVPGKKIIDTEAIRHEKPLKNSATKSKSKFSKEFHTKCSWLSAEVDPITDSYLSKKEHLQPSSYFNPLVGVILQSIILVHPRKGRELFYQWQRQRKIWWRKFSFSPGRFTVTDVAQDKQAEALSPHLRGLLEDPLQSVHITAGFECGPQFLEIVQLCSLRDIHALNISDSSGKPVSPLCLVSSVNLQAACLGFLGDCIEEEQCVPQDTNIALRLHRRLAPYQCSVVTDTKDLPSDDLLQLARYMWGVLRGMGVSTLHLPQVHTHTVDEHFKELDLIGVPFTLVLNEDSLKCGMLQIRNRDTTLMEQVHVTDVSDYMVKLAKSY